VRLVHFVSVRTVIGGAFLRAFLARFGFLGAAFFFGAWWRFLGGAALPFDLVRGRAFFFLRGMRSSYCVGGELGAVVFGG